MRYVCYAGVKYHNSQFMRLWRRLSDDGWAVSISVAPHVSQSRHPGAAWCCQVNYSDIGGSRVGGSSWEALARAVSELVNPTPACAARQQGKSAGGTINAQ